MTVHIRAGLPTCALRRRRDEIGKVVESRRPRGAILFIDADDSGGEGVRLRRR
jgi:hypothetical protein